MAENLPLGGTAVGTGINTHRDFGRLVAARLSAATGIDFAEAPNHYEAQATRDCIVEASGELKTIAVSLTRIANDIRLLGSGPRCGLFELSLPATQPGSSIMPGKVNPVLAECWNMTMFDVWGRDQTIAACVQAGQFELNVMMPMMGYALLHNIEIITNISREVSERCVKGIVAHEKICRDYASKSVSLATALNPLIGYRNAAEAVKKAVSSRRPIQDVVVEMGFASREEVRRVLDPLRMIAPGIAEKPAGKKSKVK
jgi:fumarate hydratase class II